MATTMSSIVPTLASISDYSNVVTILYQVLSIVEFLVYIPTIPLTILCAFIISDTSILHRNMKCILLGQCFYVSLFALSRFYFIIASIATGNPFYIGLDILYGINFFAIVFGNLVGHVLLIERILATIFVDGYEKYRDWDFTLAWIIAVFVLSFANSYYQVAILGSLVNLSEVTMYTHVIAMFASFVEIFIMILITSMNVNKFKIVRNTQNVHALTVRYQLMENIRTGKQLSPTFFCHFISVLISFLMIVNIRFKWIIEVNATTLITGIAYLVHAVNNFMLCLTVIIFHPILNRNARKLLRYILEKLFCFGKIGGTKIGPSSVNDIDICPLPVDVNGKLILGNPLNPSGERTVQTTETYFQQFHSSWA